MGKERKLVLAKLFTKCSRFFLVGGKTGRAEIYRRRDGLLSTGPQSTYTYIHGILIHIHTYTLPETKG